MKVLVYFSPDVKKPKVKEIKDYLKGKGHTAIIPCTMGIKDKRLYFKCCISLVFNVDSVWIYSNDKNAHRLHSYAKKKGKKVRIICPTYYDSDFQNLMSDTKYIL